MSNVINGITFEKMMRNALNNIYVHEKEINDMNVFPVADGDTGTNMRLTLENGLKTAPRDKHLGNYLKGLSNGMLLGARGNSGVILSQLFRGMYTSLKSKSIGNPGEIRDAFINGYKTAYKAVLNPVEGTILTVCRLGIDNIKHLIKGSISQKDTFKLYLKELNKALELTPTLLPVLKEANVLDSGAKGYIVIVEGMYKYLLGQIIDRDLVLDEPHHEEVKKNEVVEGFLIDISIKINIEEFKVDELYKKLENLSDTLEVEINNDIVTIKATSKDPSKVISEIRKFGSVVSLKLENNDLAAKETKEEEIPFKAIIYIACVSGSGIRNIYKEMGVDIFLNSNPSTQDFLNAFNRANAERIVILPNDKNIIETANQAVNISKAQNITIIPTKNVIEGYYCLAMDVPDTSIENRLNAIKEDVGVECLNVSKAIKQYSNENVKVEIGDYVTYQEGKILSNDKNILKCLSKALKSHEDIDSKNSALIFLGKNLNEEFSDKLNEFFIDEFDNIEATILLGEQEKEDLIIGLL